MRLFGPSPSQIESVGHRIIRYFLTALRRGSVFGSGSPWLNARNTAMRVCMTKFRPSAASISCPIANCQCGVSWTFFS